MSEDMVPVRKNLKKGLGRGLNSLLGNSQIDAEQDEFKRVETHAPVAASPRPVTPVEQPAPSIPEEARVWIVGIERVIPNREQPRKHFDPEKLKELADSIKQKGILLPILVRKIEDGKLEIIAGERRWRASQLAGLKEVPVLIKKTEKQEALELALIENIQRADLNPVEEAEAYQHLANRYSLTQQQIAEKVGKERATVANIMRLLGLQPEVRQMLKSGDLQLGQAKVLLGVNDAALQKSLADKVVKQKLTVRATERLVQKALDPAQDKSLELEDSSVKAHELKPLIAELQKHFGTKVEIDVTGSRSRVAINFYSMEELNRFIDKIRDVWH